MRKWTQKPPLGAQIDWSHPLSRGLAACWLMNEGSGNWIYDLSGNGNYGILTGMAPSASPTGWVPGPHGPELAFDGVDDYVDCGNKVSLNLSVAMTVVASIYKADWTTGTTAKYIVSKRYDAFEISITNQARLRFQANRAGGVTASFDQAISPGEHQIVFQFDANRPSSLGQYHALYLDGFIKPLYWTAGADTNVPLYTNAYNLWIGQRVSGGANFADASIDFVMIYNRALSGQEIWQLNTEPFCFIRPATKKYWQIPLSSRGLVTFDRVLTPAGSFWPTHNPNYGDGYVRTIRRHQPKSFCGADLYSYNKGDSEGLHLRWAQMPGADLTALLTFFGAIAGARRTFTFTDPDGAVHTARLANADALTHQDVGGGRHEVTIDLELS